MPQHSSQDENRETTSQSHVTGEAGAEEKDKRKEKQKSEDTSSTSVDQKIPRSDEELSSLWTKEVLTVVSKIVDERMMTRGKPTLSNLDISCVCLRIIESEKWQQFTAQLERSVLAKITRETETAAPKKRSRRCEQRELEKRRKEEQHQPREQREPRRTSQPQQRRQDGEEEQDWQQPRQAREQRQKRPGQQQQQQQHSWEQEQRQQRQSSAA